MAHKYRFLIDFHVHLRTWCAEYIVIIYIFCLVLEDFASNAGKTTENNVSIYILILKTDLFLLLYKYSLIRLKVL